jgi:hypothetical protein
MTTVNFNPAKMTAFGAQGQQDIATMCTVVRESDPTLYIHYNTSKNWFIISGKNNLTVEQLTALFQSRTYRALRPEVSHRENDGIVVKIIMDHNPYNPRGGINHDLDRRVMEAVANNIPGPTLP